MSTCKDQGRVMSIEGSNQRLFKSITMQAVSLLGASAGPETPSDALKCAINTHGEVSEDLKSKALSFVEEVHDAVQSGRDVNQRTLEEFVDMEAPQKEQ